MSVIIQNQDFDVGLEYQRLCDANPKAGAVVFFVGLVRDFYSEPEQASEDSDSSPNIDYLELEHYAGMTESLCQETITQAIARFGVADARVIHRVGKLSARAQIVFVAVAGQHRSEAFQAAEFIMDYLKSTATIWKKEVGSDGAHWLGMKDKDAQAAKRWKSSER